MIILALDTTSDSDSLAIQRDGETLSELVLPPSSGASAQSIFPAIEEVLRLAGLTLSHIDGFAAASGPGSFTGVRVGLTVVKGLAEATGKPAAAISTLRALSWFGKGALRAPVIDARRGDVYTALYDSDLRLVSAEVVVPRAEWLEQTGAHPEYAIVVQEGAYALAAAIAYCAAMDGQDGWRDPAALDANYLRRADAKLSWQDTGL